VVAFAFWVAAATLAFICAILSIVLPAGAGVADCAAGLAVPCSRAAAAAALALASAIAFVRSGLAVGVEPLVRGSGEPLFERDFF